MFINLQYTFIYGQLIQVHVCAENRIMCTLYVYVFNTVVTLPMKPKIIYFVALIHVRTSILVRHTYIFHILLCKCDVYFLGLNEKQI